MLRTASNRCMRCRHHRCHHRKSIAAICANPSQAKNLPMLLDAYYTFAARVTTRTACSVQHGTAISACDIASYKQTRQSPARVFMRTAMCIGSRLQEACPSRLAHMRSTVDSAAHTKHPQAACLLAAQTKRASYSEPTACRVGLKAITGNPQDAMIRHRLRTIDATSQPE